MGSRISNLRESDPSASSLSKNVASSSMSSITMRKRAIHARKRRLSERMITSVGSLKHQDSLKLLEVPMSLTKYQSSNSSDVSKGMSHISFTRWSVSCEELYLSPEEQKEADELKESMNMYHFPISRETVSIRKLRSLLFSSKVTPIRLCASI